MGLTGTAFSITTPTADSYINANNVSAISATGTCVTGSSDIIFSGAASGATACVSGTWSATLNFSATAEGDLNLTVSTVDPQDNTQTLSTPLIKDTVPPTVSLTSLTGGQTVGGGVLSNITWTAADDQALATTPIKLEYTLDDGTTWSVIDSAAANSGTYAWTLPSTNSTHFKIKITATDAAGNTTSTVSASDITLNFTAPTITLTSLTGGEYLQSGTTQSISWTATGSNLGATPIKIQYSIDSGTTWTTLIAATANSSPYSWVLPSIDNSQALVKLTVTDGTGLTGSSQSTSTFTIDNTNPSLTLTTPAGGEHIAGGGTESIAWTVSDLNLGSSPITLDYTLDGTTWVNIVTAHGGTSPYTWTAPTATDSSTAQVRITATDLSGRTTSVTSPTFYIDSTPPSAPIVTLTSASPTKSTSITMSITCTADYSKIYISETATAPTSAATGWQACASPTTYAISTGDGTHTVYVWSEDLAGNVSTTSGSASVSLDQTSPTLALTSLNSGGSFMGASTQSITWTASDANFGATPITIDYSSNGGSTWTNITTVANSPSSYSWTLPVLNSNQMQIRLTAVDSVGNTATVVTSAMNFTIDSIAPVISALTINASATVSNNTQAFTLTASDNLSGIAAYRFGTQSDLSTVSWITTGLPSSFSFPFVTGVYSLYAQVQDAAGNISTVMQSSNTVTIAIGQPPIVNFIQPASGNTFTSTGQTVHISWNISTASTGVNLYYSTNNGQNYTAWSGGTSLLATQNGSCVVDSGATGCADLSLPSGLANQVFEIVIFAAKSDGSQGLAVSPKYNTLAGLNLIAGRNSAVSGGQALATSLATKGGLARDPADGSIYFNQNCFISKIDGQTGVNTVFAGDPSNCNFSAEGLSPSLTTYNGGYSEYVMAIDSQRNIYWPTNDPGELLQYNKASNTVNIFLGCVNAPCSTANGTDRRSFSLPGGSISSLFVGYNDVMYFSLANSLSNGWLFYLIYKIDTTGAVSLVAGSTTLDAFMTAGALATDVNISSYVIIPGTSSSPTDTMLLSNSQQADYTKIWQVNGDQTISNPANYTCAYTPAFNNYLPSRGLVTINFQNEIDTYDPVSHTVTCDVVTTTTGTAVEVVDDGFQGFYYTGSTGLQISYVSKDNVSYIYAGTSPYAGDGGTALQAEIRSPANNTVDSSGNIYFYDSGNGRVRKIGTDGTISLVVAGNVDNSVNLSSGTAANVLINDVLNGAMGYGNAILDVTNVSAGNTLFKAAQTTDPNVFACTATTSTDPVNNLAMDYTNSDRLWSTLIAFDGSDKYIYEVELANGTFIGRSYIKKFDIGNTTMSQIAGNSSSTAGSIDPVVNGQAVAGNNVGSLYSFNAASGVFFGIDSNDILYTGTVASNWTQQATGIGNYTMGVDQATKNMYYIRNNILYQKVYQADGSGAETQIADFTAALSNSFVTAYDTGLAHSVMINDGNYIYTYTNATLIP